MFFATGMTFLQNQKIIKNLDLPVPYSRREKLCFYAVCHGDCFLYRKWVRRVTHTPFAMSKTSVFPYDIMFCKFELGCKVETMFVSLLNDVLNVFCFQRYLQCRTLTQYKVYPEEHIYSLQFVVGVTLWAFGFWTNLEADDILRNLRKPGDKKQVIWCRRREYCMLVQILHTLRTQVVF